jgi:hypothetical protein
MVIPGVNFPDAIHKQTPALHGEMSEARPYPVNSPLYKFLIDSFLFIRKH